MVLAYQGGKKRFAKIISSKILEQEKKYNEYLKSKKGKDKKESRDVVAPFFGMGSVEFELAKSNKKIYARDINKDIMKMWKALYSTDWLPEKNINEKQYNDYKKQKEPSAERGYYLTAYSFGGVFGNSFRPKYQSKEKTKLDMKSMYNKIVNISDYFKGEGKGLFNFKSCSYEKINNPKNKIIYADPPTLSIDLSSLSILGSSILLLIGSKK